MTQTNPNQRIASALAARTNDAYSFDAYGPDGWTNAAMMLLDRGYTEREAEAILRSKWTRWAGDVSPTGSYGAFNGTDLAMFLDDRRNRCTAEAVSVLVAETFESVS